MSAPTFCLTCSCSREEGRLHTASCDRLAASVSVPASPVRLTDSETECC